MGDRRHRTHLSSDTFWGAFSPDSRWATYLEPDGLYVSPVPVIGPRIKVAPKGADEPHWTRLGDLIYYRAGPRWMAVPVSTANGFHAGEPRLAFSGRYLQVAGQSYDLDPSDRLVLLLGRPEETTTRLSVITGLFELLRRIAPIW